MIDEIKQSAADTDIDSIISRLSPEIEIVYRTAQPTMTAISIERCRAILCEYEKKFNWGSLVDLGLKHRVLQNIGWNFYRYTLGPISQSYHFLLQSVYLCNYYRNITFSKELRQALILLNQRGIPAMVRKGIVMANLVYSDQGIRYMNDIDFFVPNEYLEAFIHVMDDLGYAMGRDSPDRRVIAPLNRDAQVQWKLQIGSLPPFLRTTSEPYIDILAIDARKQMMEPASGKYVPMEDLIARSETQTLVSEPVQMLSPEDFLIDLTVHIYREANMLQAMDASKDLCLYRFLDVAEYCRFAEKRIDPRRLGDIVGQYNIQEEVYYGLYFTNLYLGGVINPKLLEMTKPRDTSYLDEYGTLDRQVSRWSIGFFERLFDWTRSAKHKGQSTLVRPRRRRGDMRS